ESLVWDRKRTLRTFGFEHSLEAYLPSAKRVHGYYTMPLLARGQLVGRVDPARSGQTLVARQLSVDKPWAADAMARALVEAAAWVGCDSVRIGQANPPHLEQRLRSALTAAGACPSSGHAKRLAELDQLLPDRDHDGLHPGVNLQLLENIAHVILHRVLGDKQLLGDVAVVHPPRNELEHLHFPVGQPGCRELPGPLLFLVAAGEAGELGQQLSCHGRVDQRLAAVHRPHCVRHLVKREILEQIAAGSRADCLEEVSLLVADREHDYLGAGRDLLHGPARLDAAAAGHPDIHQDDVGERLPGLLHRLGAVTGLAHQLDVRLSVQDHLQAPAKQRVIIDDQGADGFGMPRTFRSRSAGPGTAVHEPSSPCCLTGRLRRAPPAATARAAGQPGSWPAWRLPASRTDDTGRDCRPGPA